MKKLNKVLMAFATGSESTEGVVFPKFIGVGSFNVVGINPSKAEMEAIYGATFDKDPEYVSKDDDGVAQVRIDFILKSIPEKNDGIELITKASFFLKKMPFISKTDKVQVINVYGATTWIDVATAKTGVVPEHLHWYEGPYRPAFIGEEDLTNFLKTYLGVPNKSYKDQKTGEIVTIKNPADAEARLENIDKYFAGNVKELADIIAFQPNNKIKAAVGVKTTDENKQYQALYIKKFLKNGVTDYSKLDAEIKLTQTNGGYKNIEFSVEPLHAYAVEATDLGSMPAAGAPSGPVDMSSYFGGAAK